VEGVHSLDLRAAFLGNRKSIADLDPLDYEHTVLGLDLPDGFDLVTLGIDFDLARFQRASEGAGQSAAGGCHHIVERGGMRWVLLRSDAVMVGDLRVHAEDDGLVLGWQVGEPLRAAEPLDPYPRDIGDLTHGRSLQPPAGVNGAALRLLWSPVIGRQRVRMARG
jgi:hypothetical protein